MAPAAVLFGVQRWESTKWPVSADYGNLRGFAVTNHAMMSGVRLGWAAGRWQNSG